MRLDTHMHGTAKCIRDERTYYNLSVKIQPSSMAVTNEALEFYPSVF